MGTEQADNSCYVHTGETAKHLYERAAELLQASPIGLNWSQLVTVSSLLWVRQSRGQMVHFGHTEGVDGLV